MKKFAHSQKGSSRRIGGPKRRGFFVCFGIIAVLICAFALSRRNDSRDAQLKSLSNPNREERPLSVNTDFGEFPPNTQAEAELEKLLRGKDENIDLALANWLVAEDVPQFANVTRESYFKRLDIITQHVREEMARRQEVARSRGRNPNDPDTRCATFCGAMITLGFAYREEFAQHDLTPQQMRGLYADANNMFLVGLMSTMRGTCVSMPLIYLVVGQRLDLPVHLVQIGKHCFIRWQEPSYRLNIETTHVDKVWVTDDDSAYIEEEKMTRDQVTGNELRNLSNREIVASLLFIRSSHWVMKAKQEPAKSRMDISRAFHLAPEDPAVAKTYQAVSNQNGIKRRQVLEKIPRTENAVRGTVEPGMPPLACAQVAGSGPQRPQQSASCGFNPTPTRVGNTVQLTFGQQNPGAISGVPGRPSQPPNPSTPSRPN